MIVLVVTCAARGAHYLANLLRQIEASGWKGPRFIVSDGPLALPTNWPSFSSNSFEGQKRTYWRALAIGRDLSLMHGSCRVLILEDDVELCRNALTYMERARLPRSLDFVTWFDGHVLPRGAPPGIYPVSARHFFCLQAVTWTPAAMDTLLQSPEADAWTQPHSGDILIARILANRRYGVHVPNLVQHLGKESICNPGQKLTGVRTASNYRGPLFDAMTLGRPAASAGAGQPGT